MPMDCGGRDAAFPSRCETPRARTSRAKQSGVVGAALHVGPAIATARGACVAGRDAHDGSPPRTLPTEARRTRARPCGIPSDSL